jgi:hypothetical protein
MDDHLDGYVAESQEFWMFADDLLASSLEIYSLHPFIGAEKGGGGPDVPALLVAFGAGTLAPMVTAFVQYLMKYLSRNENRELTIERGDVKLTLKGRNLAEEKELIRMLFPEVLVTWGLNIATYDLPGSGIYARVNRQPDPYRRRDEPWAVAPRTSSC